MSPQQFDSHTLNLLRGRFSPAAVEWGLRVLNAGGVELANELSAGESKYYHFYVVDIVTGGTRAEVLVSVSNTGALMSETEDPATDPSCEVAAILFLIEEGMVTLSGPGNDIPRWQHLLDSVLPPLLAESMPRDTGKPICLFFSEEDGALRIRPGERGKNGWIKGNARWDRLSSLRASEKITELLYRIYDTWDRQDSGGMTFRGGYGYGWGYQIDWMIVNDLNFEPLWDILVELQRAGVEFIAWDGREPVELSDNPARVRVSVLDDGGDLRIVSELCYGETVVRGAENTSHVLVGVPVRIAAQVEQVSQKKQRIRLHRFNKPLSNEAKSLLFRMNSLQVEAKDRDNFERDYLPRIQKLVSVESPDSSYQPPVPTPTELKLTVTPVTDQNDDLVRVDLHWAWIRGAVQGPEEEHEARIVEAVQATGIAVIDHSLPTPAAVPFLAETLLKLEDIDYLKITVTAEVPDYRPAPEAPEVQIGVSAADNDWFDLGVEVTVGGERVEFVRLFTALNRGDEVFILPSGTYFRLDTPEFDQLRRIIEEAKTLNDTSVDKLRISRYQVDLWEELVDTGIVQAQEHEWWDRVHALVRDSDEKGVETNVPVPSSLHATLREYQVGGYRWLDMLRRHQLGGILADDMGLGKTLQVIAMIAAAVEQDPDSPPFLVIAPTSVVSNWGTEIQKFAPDLTAVLIEETEKKRGTSLADLAGQSQVVVTSYTLFRLEFDEYEKQQWAGIIFDEAQMIKNHASKAYKYARLIDSPVKIAVTGTPMENNLMELWALVSLSCPGLLGGKTHFTDYYRTPIEKEGNTERLDQLQRRMRPFLLRRTKELVASDLPAKTENVMELDLYPKHRRIYDRRLQRERQKVLGLVDDLNSNRFEVFRSLTLLRQLALDTELAGDEGVPSAKLDTLTDLLTKAAAEGHRVLVLSQFTRFLTKARDAATEAGIESLYLDGKSKRRKALIDSFREGKAPAFFISLKAGGFGLNLTEADYVVLLDPWWNPATEAQAVDRAHRIGQTRQVMVYRLVAKDTIESKVMALKASKAALFDRVLEGGGSVEADGLGVDDIKSLME